jgi:Poxvirus A32 protein
MNPLKITPLKTKKSDLPQSPFMEADIINRFPSLTLCIGKSGSGKSNVMANMLTKKEFMKDFFDDIYLFSPTAKSDDIVEHLKLKDNHIIENLDETAITKLNKIVDDNIEKIKKQGIANVALKSKILIICDDCISEKVFIKSNILSKLATAGRHALISTVICSQSYTKIPRVIRLQAQGMIIFPSSNDELDLLCEDLCPPGMGKKSFLELIKFATDERYSFLFVNHHAKNPKEKFRKNFDEIIEY